MGAMPQGLSCFSEGQKDIEMGNGREFHRQVMLGCPLIPDAGLEDPQVTGAQVRLHTAGGTHPDQRVRTDLIEFFNRNGCRGVTDPGGNNENHLTRQGTRDCAELPVVGYFAGVCKMLSNFFASSGVAGEQNITPDIPRFDL